MINGPFDPMANHYGDTLPADLTGDECIGACGLVSCIREDCRRCDICGDLFDADLQGGRCDTWGDFCNCQRVSCMSDCCYDADAAYEAWKDDRD